MSCDPKPEANPTDSPRPAKEHSRESNNRRRRRFEDEVRTAVRGREEEVVERLCGSVPPTEPNKGGPCPKCGGTDRWHRMPEKEGAVGGTRCRQCNPQPNGGDVFSTVQWFLECNFGTALRKVGEVLGIEPPERQAGPSGAPKPPLPRPANDRQAAQWAKRLELPWDAIRSLRGGIFPAGGDLAWTESDGNGNPIGTGRRTPDGKKLTAKGSKRGLILPADENELRQRIERLGFVFLPEGFTDAAALWALGLPAVARPQAKGGKIPQFIAEFFKRIDLPESPRIVVLAENDRKDDGTWPGSDGAEATAQALANRLGRAVETAFPPVAADGTTAKDVRAWTQGRGLGAESDPTEWERCGVEFVAGLDRGNSFEPADGPDEDGGSDDPSGLRSMFEAAERERDASRVHRNRLPLIAVGPGADGMFDPAGDVERTAATLPANDPRCILVGNVLSRMTRDGGLRIFPHTPETFRLLISTCANFFESETKDGCVRRKHVWPSQILARGILESCDIPAQVARVDFIVRFPVLRPDGMFTQQGFDAASRVFCDSDAAGRIPESPAYADARAAADGLLDLVDEFPWRTPADRAAWLAFLLSFVLRPAIDGPVPFFEFGATVNGSGKGLLLQVAWAILTNSEPALSGLPTDDPEIDKRILAMLQAGSALIVWDDVHHPIGGSSLQRYLTSRAYSGRELGATRMLSFPARTIMAATGNNIEYLTPDMRRRVLPIRLKALDDPVRPERAYRYPDLPRHVREGYPSHLVGLLTIVRAWIVAGKPAGNLRPFPSFEAWGIVRSVLVWLGEPDPLDTRTELERERDTAAEALADFLGRLHRRFIGREASATEICGAIAEDSSLAESFSECTGRAVDARLNGTIVGRELAKLRDRPACDAALRSRMIDGRTRYRVDFRNEPRSEPRETLLFPHDPISAPQPQEIPEFKAEVPVDGGCRGSEAVPPASDSDGVRGDEPATGLPPGVESAFAELSAVAVDEPAEPFAAPVPEPSAAPPADRETVLQKKMEALPELIRQRRKKVEPETPLLDWMEGGAA